tara:strand:- start:706 stop:948 length:243 start_codon:yes stop_codon:yes gene_type:complete
MIEQVNGYKYTTEADVIAARKKCADHYGLPKTPEDTTLYWVNYIEADLDTPVFWYIMFTDSIRVILGAPTDFYVTQPDIT